MKKNNNGFSLVELIVVVLIMAIIAVALAPQVMKWVENSRKSTDCNNYDSVVSAVNIALANETVMKKLPSDGITLTWDATVTSSDTASWSQDPAASATVSDIITEVGKTLGENWFKSMNVKRTTTLPGDNKYTIKIDGNGTVSRGVAPSSDDIS